MNVVIVTGGEMLEQGFEGEQCTQRGWREGGREGGRPREAGRSVYASTLSSSNGRREASASTHVHADSVPLSECKRHASSSLSGGHEQAREHARVHGSVPPSTFNSCLV